MTSELCAIRRLVNTSDIQHEMVAKPFHGLPVSCCYAGDYGIVNRN
jgi:hypothetical protein